MDPKIVTTTGEKVMQTVVDLVSIWGVQVVGAVALLLIGRWVAGMVRSATRRALERGGVDRSLIPFFSSLAYYATLAVVLISVLNLFGIETTSLVAVLGAAGCSIPFPQRDLHVVTVPNS